MGERLLRRFEKWLTPWYDRSRVERQARAAQAAVQREQRKAGQSEALRQRAISARIAVEQLYDERLVGRRS